jgi:CheY-like chemotaxis protein
MLRELVERLANQGVDVAVLELADGLRAIVEDPAALLVLDVDDANYGHAVPAVIATRVDAAVHQTPGAGPVAIATRATAGTILTCQRAGASAFVDLAHDSIDAAIALLARTARERRRAATLRRALDQAHGIVDELLRDLVRTERRSIDLEKQLARHGALTESADDPDDAAVGAPADIDDLRAPVVMVIDDDRAVVDELVGRLEAAGLTTFAFVTGEEAVDQAARMAQRGEALDLVAVALELPGIDGLEVVRRLRKDRPALAAFLLIDRADPTMAARATDQGAVGLASKPFDDPGPVVQRIQDEAAAAMARTREHGYLQRIKARHDRVLSQYRLLLAGLEP